MATTDYEDKIRQAGKKRSESYNSTGQQAADALTGAAEQFATETEQANAAYLQGLNDAQKLYQQRMDEGYTQFADIIAGSQRDAQAELAQEQQEIANKQKAARWTGAAELASSVANMIGVGSFNAANQQYKTYSQDWMRQADADMRAHRAKVGNLRERQRAMQQQLLQLRMNNAGQALQAAQRQAEAERKANEQSAAARRDAATAGVKVQLDAADRAAAAEYEGEVTAANMGQRQEQMAQQDRHFNAQMGQRNKEFAARMAAQGLTPTGDIDEGRLKKNYEISAKYGKGKKTGGYTLNLLEYNEGDKHLPAESITLPDESSMRETIYANIDAVTDLSEAQKRKILDLMDDDTMDPQKKADNLKRYIVSSGQLRSVLRGSQANGYPRRGDAGGNPVLAQWENEE